MRDAWANASTSDRLIGLGGPVVGLLALIAGLTSSDMVTTLVGAVALAAGIAFAVGLGRAADDPRDRE